jgi:three-Cys-motif partner protein
MAATGAIETLINFPLGMAIHRDLRKSGSISDERRAALDAFFGSREWWDQVYEESGGLFGDTMTTKLSGSGERILEWYRGRLRAEFGHVSNARLIKNTKGGHLYYLVWAGHTEMGLRGANYILKMGDRILKQNPKKD